MHHPKALTKYLTRELERERRKYSALHWASFDAWAPITEFANKDGVGISVSRDLFRGLLESNACVIDIPSEGEIGRRVYQTSNLVALCTLAARRWEPDYGVVIDSAYHDVHHKKHGVKKRSPGWMVYLSRRLG